jgi:hypothetical protein
MLFCRSTGGFDQVTFCSVTTLYQTKAPTGWLPCGDLDCYLAGNSVLAFSGEEGRAGWGHVSREIANDLISFSMDKKIPDQGHVGRLGWIGQGY